MPRERGLTGEDGGTSRGADEVLALCSRTRTERHNDAHAPHSGGARAAWCARASSLLCLPALTPFNSVKLHCSHCVAQGCKTLLLLYYYKNQILQCLSRVKGHTRLPRYGAGVGCQGMLGFHLLIS